MEHSGYNQMRIARRDSNNRADFQLARGSKHFTTKKTAVLIPF
jgi:hypothetical protein